MGAPPHGAVEIPSAVVAPQSGLIPALVGAPQDPRHGHPRGPSGDLRKVADVVEAALAHQDENEIRRAYNRASYWSERVALLQTWADLLDDFRRQPQRTVGKH